MGADRLRAMFAGTRAAGRAAFLPFMTAGLPTPAESPEMFAAMAGAGADGFEVGIPYSDPLMDGPVIQRGSDAAIAAGTTLEAGFDILAKVTASTGLPALVMTYSNPVFRHGVDWFCERLADAGADGIIVPDLPVEESAALGQAAQRHGLGMVLFVAPTSDRRRIEAVVAADPVFVYAVAEMGVTGERADGGVQVASLVARIREVSEGIPIVLGVGISRPEQARAAADSGADGVIVGSALVRRVLESGSSSEAADALRDAVLEFAAALTI